MRPIAILFALSCFAFNSSAEESIFAQLIASKGSRNIVVTMPDFPKTALEQNISGTAYVEFMVGRDGYAKDVDVLESDPPKLFDAVVKKAVESWIYLPDLEQPCGIGKVRSRQRIWLGVNDGEPTLSLSKVVDVSKNESPMFPGQDGKPLAEIKPGNSEDERLVLIEKSNLRYKQGKEVAATYPYSARQNNKQGLVVAAFAANPDGKIDEVSIIYSIPDQSFENTVRSALLRAELETTSGNQLGKKYRVCQLFTFLLK